MNWKPRAGVMFSSVHGGGVVGLPASPPEQADSMSPATTAQEHRGHQVCAEIDMRTLVGARGAAAFVIVLPSPDVPPAISPGYVGVSLTVPDHIISSFWLMNGLANVIAKAALLAVLCQGLASCGGGAAAAPRPVSLGQDVRPIFMTSCALGNTCHGSPTAAGHVQLGPTSDIDAATLVGNLVNVPSVVSANDVRVRPGDRAASLLVGKLTGDFSGLTCNPSACGARMPFNSPPLPAAMMDTIARWVDEGASEN